MERLRWEYLVRTRHRDQGMLKAGNWKDDVVKDLDRLGNDGWELVAVSPQSGVAGGSGTTTEEIWVFKRPR